ncbi:class I SAM-dependent methyltransferase [bacterium CPR1]|nr:class I SAM-dependent methyltransferase [bacterium CPR1]
MFHPDGPSLLELLRQALSSTEHGYDLLAPKFEKTPFCTPASLLEAAHELLPRGQSGLDLCCGTGAGLGLLRELGCQRLVGVDFSRGMLEQARRACPDAELVQGDALDARYESEFDLVTFFGALGHILPEDLPALVDVVDRALRPGGSFVFFVLPRTGIRNLAYLAACFLFDLVMRVRNLLLKPQFIMYYLASSRCWFYQLLRERGFQVQEHSVLDCILVLARKC